MALPFEQRVIKLTDQGYSAEQIARACNVHVGKIRQFLEAQVSQDLLTKEAGDRVDSVIDENRTFEKLRRRSLERLFQRVENDEVTAGELIRATDVLHRVTPASPMKRAEREATNNFTVVINIPDKLREHVQRSLGVNEHGKLTQFGGSDLAPVTRETFDAILQRETAPGFAGAGSTASAIAHIADEQLDDF